MPLRRTLLLLAFTASTSSLPALLAQSVATPDATASSAAMPSDPVALLNLAREKNGLNSSDVKPWHLRGTYMIYDAKGAVSDTGVYEEWWVSPARYKRSFSGGKFAQVEYATGTGLYRAGTQEWLGVHLGSLLAELLRPVPEAQSVKEFHPTLESKTSPKTKMNCVSLMHETASSTVTMGVAFPTYCFQVDQPILRIVGDGGSEIVYNQMVLFQGHYLTRDVQEFLAQKLWRELKLDVVEGLKEPVDALLTPPTDAVAIDVTSSPIRLKKDEGAVLVLKKISPTYPQMAKVDHLSGEVVLKTTVGKDGHVLSVEPLRGSPILADAAMTAVRQWLYRPFVVLGQPVDVQLEVRVNFNLSP